MKSMSQDPPGQFSSSHFDEPNILVHTRSNERTLPTGERGRFIEEVQSDWHQQGKREGYQAPAAQQAEMRAKYNELARESNAAELTWERLQRDPHAKGRPGTPERDAYLKAAGEVDRLRAEKAAILTKFTGGVPDAPFKETWPDLGLKQELLETAADPHAQWIGHTSGQTQAARYDLSKQISRIEFDAGDRQLRAFNLNGDEVIRQTTGPENLGDYIGKEAADKLLKSKPSLHPDDQTPLYSLSGLDLQVGGEGMKHFYDQLLPKRLEKILKPFGGTVEQVRLGARSKAQIDAEMDALFAMNLSDEQLRTELNRLQHERGSAVADPAWIARLTPEMKARILKEGLPLGVLLGLTPLSQLGRPSPPEKR